MKFSLFITASKLMAFIIVVAAFVLDLLSKSATAFMFSVPFVSALVLGKQYLDSKNGKEATSATS